MRAGDGWPRPTEELLLRACLLDEEAAVGSWRRWREEVEFETIGFASLRLLPLAYRNLPSGLDDSVWGRVRGIYRRSWTSNQLSFRAAAPIIEAMERDGIETLVLKGAAVSSLHYRDTGARWMGDVDVLVRPQQLDRAHAILSAAGWESTEGDPRALAAVRHSTPYVRRGGKEQIDLHWRALWQPGPDDGFWQRAVPLDLAGVPTRALGDTDQVLHACVHGLEWNPGQLHWAADVATTIRGGAVDWTLLFEAARARRATVCLNAALDYLSRALSVSVPGDALSALRSVPAGRRERAAFAAIMRPPGALRTLRISWDNYRRQHELSAPGPRSSTYLSHLRDTFDLQSRRQLVGFAARRVLGGLRPRRG